MPMRRRRGSVTPVMRHYCEMIAAELASWPGVSSRRMFGLKLFYREQLPFVVLPETKEFRAADRVGFKLHWVSKSDRKRLLADEHLEPREGAKWITFAVREGRDIALFLRWAEKAYQSCRQG